MMQMKLFRRVMMPVGLSLLAVTVFMGCRAEVAVRGRNYSDRVWGSDPYCYDGYGYGYGCRYGRDDGFRLDIIRRGRWGGGWRGLEAGAEATTAATAKKPTSWEKEFNLKPANVAAIKSAFDSALNGRNEQLLALGIYPEDLQKMAQFEMPSNESLNNVGHKMGVNPHDLKDFTEVFMIRMKAAFAANE